MRLRSSWLLAGIPLIVASLTIGCEVEKKPAPTGARAYLPKRAPHTDHSSFFTKPFADGPSVTKACLKCHPNASHEVMKTSHWNWQAKNAVVLPGQKKAIRLGKKNAFNNFCINTRTNEKMCTKCHIGYGWKDKNFDFGQETHVDCLACHDTSGGYAKAHMGEPAKGVNLLAAARSVGHTSRGTCGNCHFYGGGGNSVKHGDMSATLFNPWPTTDVHMGKNNMDCADCHRAKHHDILGRAMSVSPSAPLQGRIACTDCHKGPPHKDSRLNAHIRRVACQACHVPHMNPDEATKMTWDWSQAGQDNGIKDIHVYMKIKGRFTYVKNAMPEYFWYNKMATHYLQDDKIDPDGVTSIDAPIGNIKMPGAQIWPFKVHRGKQIYDKVYKTFLIPHLIAPDGYWKTFDWALALTQGSKITGQKYSGKYGFAKTEMYWPLTHMVTPKEEALRCGDCHGPKGRLDWKRLGFEGDPINTTAKPRMKHDAISLLDADEEPVSESGKPVSVKTTCGACHDIDADLVAKHVYHAKLDPAKLPPEQRDLVTFGAKLTESGDANCLLCHLKGASVHDFQRTLRTQKDWAVTATLLGTTLPSEATATEEEASAHGHGHAHGTPLVTMDKDGKFTYNKEAFKNDEVQLNLGKATSNNCAGCHGAGQARDDHRPFKTLPSELTQRTLTTGQVFSGEQIRTSGMNVANRDARAEPWDVHAQRLVKCTDCHYNAKRPARLVGDKVEKTPAGKKASCLSCHDITGLHNKLKESKRHLAALSCEACHVPKLQLGGAEQLDHTMLRVDGSPLIVWRGVTGGSIESPATLIAPVDPILGLNHDGKISPHNIVSTWRWVDAAGKPVSNNLLRRALIKDGAYLPELIAAFDKNSDKQLSDVELRLDTPKKTALVSARLASVGIKGPKITGDIRSYSVHHGIQRAPRADDCARCHTAHNQDADRIIPLATYLPGGVEPKPVEGFAQRMTGRIEKSDKGLTYRTKAVAARLLSSKPKEGKAK